MQRHFGGPALVLGTDAGDRLLMPASPPPGFDPSVAHWAFDHGQSAGLGTATLAGQRLALRAAEGADARARRAGARAGASRAGCSFPSSAAARHLARQIAIALERVHYVEVAQQAVVEMESERLRNALLAAISHDVRTPLAALIALAESLRRCRRRWPGAAPRWRSRWWRRPASSTRW